LPWVEELKVVFLILIWQKYVKLQLIQSQTRLRNKKQF